MTIQFPGNHFNNVASMFDAGIPDIVSKTCEVMGSRKKKNIESQKAYKNKYYIMPKIFFPEI